MNFLTDLGTINEMTQSFTTRYTIELSKITIKFLSLACNIAFKITEILKLDE